MNEGRVQLGSRSVEIGRLRSAASLAGGLILGAGIAIGVASAAPTAGATALTTLPVRLDATGRFASGRVTELEGSQLKLALPRSSAASAQSQAPAQAAAQDPASAVDPAPPPTRTIHLQPRTRLPAQRPRPGDYLLGVGRPEADGSLTASAITARRPAQLQRRQAALTTTRAAERA